MLREGGEDDKILESKETHEEILPVERVSFFNIFYIH